MFKKVLFSTLVLAATCSVQAQSFTASGWLPASHALTTTMMDWAKQVENETQGRVKFNLLPKGVASPAGTYDAVRDGLADISYTVQGYTPGRFPLAEVAELPFLGDSAVQTSIAFNRIANKYPQIAGEYKDVKVLAFFTHGPGHIFNTKRPINSFADMQGLKFRVGGGMVNELSKVMGMNALLKPAPESYELLSSGVVDGVLFPSESTRSFKLDAFIKHKTSVPGGFYNTAFMFFMNPKAWAKISPQDQATITKLSGDNYARMMGLAWDKVDREGNAGLQAKGATFTQASPAFVKEIQSKTTSLEKRWVDVAKSKGIAAPEKVIQELRAEIKKL